MTKIRLTNVYFNVHLLYKFNNFHFIKVHVGFLHPSSGEGCRSTKCLAQHNGAAYMVIIVISRHNLNLYGFNLPWNIPTLIGECSFQLAEANFSLQCSTLTF